MVIPLESQIGPLLINKGYFLSCAESCTGGLMSHLITNIPGSSAYFIGGVSTYAYEAKKKLLGVKSETLEKYGAVSGETVFEMAIGVRKLFAGEIPEEKLIGLSISGIAGPGGGMPDKPVGLVWFGFSSHLGTWAVKKYWDGNRQENKSYSANYALSLLVNFLNGMDHFADYP